MRKTHEALLVQLIDVGAMSVRSGDEVRKASGGQAAEDREEKAGVEISPRHDEVV